MPYETHVVNGNITQLDGSPLAELTVKAFDRDLRREELLREATTDQDGHYTITYTADQLIRPDKTEADLLVRVYDPDDEEVASSPVRFNAQPEARNLGGRK